MTPPLPVALSFQAGYRCRHSGACCTAGWPIPVDDERAAAMRAAFGDGGITASAVLAKHPSGACAFYDRQGRRCTVHGRLGLRAIPLSCAHFPRRLLIEDDRIAISLSHYCPTVADLLFDPPGAGPSGTGVPAHISGTGVPAHISGTGVPAGPAIVEAPWLLEGIEPEGLDARGAWPPLLRPGVLAGVASYRRWERAVVETLAAAEGSPEAALARVKAMTREVLDWKPAIGPLDGWVAECATHRQSPSTSGDAPSPDWRGLEGAVGRYLATKAFANWAAYQGDGLQAVLGSVERALDVLREEAAAARARANRELDRPLLTEAFRQADLRIMHRNG